MTEFTPICQRYTDVMAHKYYLQDILFDRTIKDALVIERLTLIISKLQTMAYNLKTAQVCSVYCLSYVHTNVHCDYYRWKMMIKRV